MNAYKYKAVSKDGETVTGVIEAYDEFEAVASIKETCTLVLKIDQVKTHKRERIDLNEPMWVSDKALALVSAQFAILLRSGLPAARTVEVVAQQTTDKLLKRILTQVAEDVSAGYPLSQSLENRGKKIPLTFIETVRAGEESGTLETSFDRLKVYYEKSDKIRAKVKAAMAYPIFLLILAFVVITLVVNITLPTIGGVILDSGGELPLPTRMLLGGYEFTKSYWWAILTVILLIAGAIILYKRTDKGRYNLAHLSTKLPILGKIAILKGSSQFANTLSTLLAAGLPLSKAIAITARILDNYAIGSTVGKCTLGLEEGKSLGTVLWGNPYLSPLLIEMAAVGEESGALEDTLGTIGLYFDAETERASAKALSMMEPIMTVILGGIIGFIVVALYMPMFTMYNGM